MPPQIAAWVFSLLSGCAALLYQVLWAREFALVLGGTTHAISTVLAAFMAGLGFGGIFWGPFVDRRRAHPLRVYSAIETGIVVGAVLVEALIWSAPTLYRGLYQLDLPP